MAKNKRKNEIKNSFGWLTDDQAYNDFLKELESKQETNNTDAGGSKPSKDAVKKEV
jgi:hypothetical protein